MELYKLTQSSDVTDIKPNYHHVIDCIKNISGASGLTHRNKDANFRLALNCGEQLQIYHSEVII